MKLLRFFRFIFISAILANLLVAVLYFDDLNLPNQNWRQFTQVLNNYARNLSSYFAHADGWNYLGLLIFISLIFILFVISSSFLKRYFFRSLGDEFKPFSFKFGGILWGGHKLLSVFLAILFLIGLINTAVFVFSFPQIISDIDHVQQPQTALLLGTSKRLATGDKNRYYVQRIEAMVKLYRSGKINRIIISGDNGSHNYNEPANMKVDLIRQGVDQEIIDLDFAGFRTLDSMVRLKWHFNINSVVIVSQRFHLERALFLAWFYDIEALGYVAGGNMSLAMIKRELMAKPKAMMDVFLFNMQPKFGRTPVRAHYDYTSRKGGVLLVCVSILLLVSASLLVYSLKQ